MDKKISIEEIAKKLYDPYKNCCFLRTPCKYCEFYKKGTADYTCWSLAMAVELCKCLNVEVE